MEKLIIKIAKNKPYDTSPAKYENNADIYKLLKYVVSEKGSKSEIKHWGCRYLIKNTDISFFLICKMQKYLKKDSGRRMYHFIISFPASFTDENLVFITAEKIADFIGEKYQLVYGIHTDTGNLHIHIAMNSVSYVDGHKWHKNRIEYKQWKREILIIVNSVIRKYHAGKMMELN